MRMCWPRHSCRAWGLFFIMGGWIYGRLLHELTSVNYDVRIPKAVKHQKEWWVLALRLTGLGWYVVVCILLGVLGGLWLDRRLGILPLFTLLGVLLGSVVAFWGIYRMVVPLMQGRRNKSEGDEKS